MPVIPEINPTPPSNPLPDPAAVVAAITEVVKTGAGVINTIIENPDKVTAEVLTKIDQVQAKLDTNARNSFDAVRTALNTIALPLLPPPMDPSLVLTEIATAISKAEDILNYGINQGKDAKPIGGGLLIAQGTIEVELQVLVPDGGGLGARAKIILQIGKK